MQSTLRKLLVVSVFAMAVALAIGIYYRPSRMRRPVRVARNQFESRFTESIFDEIARRRGMEVEWVQTNLPAGEALGQGHVDIWADAMPSASREREFHQTEAWSRVEFSLLSLEGTARRHP